MIMICIINIFRLFIYISCLFFIFIQIFGCVSLHLPWCASDIIDEETSSMMQQYFNDDAFYIAADRVYQSSDDEFAGMFGPIQTVAGLLRNMT